MGTVETLKPPNCFKPDYAACYLHEQAPKLKHHLYQADTTHFLKWLYTDGEYKQGDISPQNLIQMQKAHYHFLKNPKQ